MPEAFFDYVRGLSDEIPSGYSEKGMRAYRHLVLLGVRQLLEAQYPQLPEELGAEGWLALLEAFVRNSRWDSPYYGNLKDDFLDFLDKECAE